MNILTVKDAANLLDVNTKTVYRLIEAGRLPAFKVGRQWRMRMKDIESWIEEQLRVREAPGTYRVTQADLFAPGDEREDLRKPKPGFSDSAFSENSDLPIHRWIPWIAGFNATFVAQVFERYLPDGRTGDSRSVLDPFAGVGTTLVTAMLRGHLAYGFEINPYAAEACELKLAVQFIPVGELAQRIEEFRCQVRQAIRSGVEPTSTYPSGFITRSQFLSPVVQRKVLLVQDYIAGLQDPLISQCFRLALASELVGFSNYSYEPSLGTRAAAGKKDVADAPVLNRVARKLTQMVEDIEWAQKRMANNGIGVGTEFHAGDFFQLQSQLPDASIDLVVTSPPYLNNYHYIRNSRPQVYWLGHATSPKDLRPIEQGSFGKYWQTVRGEEAIALEFSMPDLEEAIALLRSRNASKGQYGGPGWGNYAATYFNDCNRFARVLRRILKPGGRAVVVLGNSILQGVEFKTDIVFARICQLAGMLAKDIVPLREKRTGTSIIKSAVRANAAQERTTLYESAVLVAQSA